MARYAVVQTELHEKADIDHPADLDTDTYQPSCYHCGLPIVSLGSTFVHGFEPVDPSEFQNSTLDTAADLR